MNYSIHFVAEVLKKATDKIAKLKLVIYNTGHYRVIKSLRHSVDLKDWDKNRERLKSSSSLAVELNSLLNAMQRELEEQVLLWEREGADWTPKILQSILYKERSEKPIQSNVGDQNLVEYWIDYQINFFKVKERFKNGVISTGTPNANNYQWLKNTLREFTMSKYKKNFSSYEFSDITESFLLSYCIFISSRGAKNGNKGGLRHKLKALKAVFSLAMRKGVKDVTLSSFDPVNSQMKASIVTPKTISNISFEQIKNYDRAKLSRKEIFYLDLFLFSYYAGGMANVDVCHLNKSCLKDGYIEYTRQKCDKTASPILLPQIQDVIDRYSSMSFGNYVLPIFNEKQQTDIQKYQKVERITLSVNKTLKKIASTLNMPDKVTWYSARGTYITNMVDAGLNAYEVANQAGNSVEIIEKHYYRVDRASLFEKISTCI